MVGVTGRLCTGMYFAVYGWYFCIQHSDIFKYFNLACPVSSPS